MPTGLSFDEIRCRVCDALNVGRTPENYVYIRELYRDAVIYTDNYADGSKLYMRPVSITEAGDVTLGEATQVQERTSYDVVSPATFSMDVGSRAETSDGYVEYTGKLFEAGDYPEVDFSINEAELAASAGVYVPVFNDLEHIPTILSEKKALGNLASVFTRGKELFGTVRLPKWLDALMEPGEPIKVSVAFAKDTKRIIGNALTLNPRIKDAQIQAAFSAAAGSSEPRQPRKDKPTMNILQRLKALFSEATDAELESLGKTPTTADPAPAAKTADQDAEIARLKAERDELAAQAKAQADARIAAESKSFADKAVSDGKCLPADAQELAAEFAQAIKDDNAGKACFSEAGAINEGDRLVRLRKRIEGTRPNPLLSEKAKVGNVLFSDNGDDAGTGINTEDIYKKRNAKPTKAA